MEEISYLQKGHHAHLNADMHALMNLPNPSTKIRSLREFYDANKKLCIWAVVIGVAIKSYGALHMLLPMVRTWKTSNRHMQKFCKATQ